MDRKLLILRISRVVEAATMSERHKNEVWVRMLNENVDDLVKYVLKYIDEEKSN